MKLRAKLTGKLQRFMSRASIIVAALLLAQGNSGDAIALVLIALWLETVDLTR